MKFRISAEENRRNCWPRKKKIKALLGIGSSKKKSENMKCCDLNILWFFKNLLNTYSILYYYCTNYHIYIGKNSLSWSLIKIYSETLMGKKRPRRTFWTPIRHRLLKNGLKEQFSNINVHTNLLKNLKYRLFETSPSHFDLEVVTGQGPRIFFSQIQFTCLRIHPFKAFNLVVFNIFTQFCNTII